MRVSGFTQPRDVEEEERWCSAAGDEWVGDRWSHFFVESVWQTAVTPDGGQWLPVRERESSECRERERKVGRSACR